MLSQFKIHQSANEKLSTYILRSLDPILFLMRVTWTALKIFGLEINHCCYHHHVERFEALVWPFKNTSPTLDTHQPQSVLGKPPKMFGFNICFIFLPRNILILKGWGLGKWGRNEVERIAPRSPGSLNGDFLHQFDLISSTFSQHFWHALTS